MLTGNTAALPTGFLEACGRARLAALLKPGPVHTPEHPLMKPESHGIFSSPNRFIAKKIKFRKKSSKPTNNLLSLFVMAAE